MMHQSIANIKTLTIVIPVYNEENSITAILNRINKVKLPNGLQKELIVIDDASSDSSVSKIEQFQLDTPELNLKLFTHVANQGKGAALHTGIEHANGQIIVIQDADEEYNPVEYSDLLTPILEGKADVVYGSRFLGDKPHRVLFFWHSIGNKFLTFLSNMFTNLNLTDMETCYKMFDASILKSLRLKEKRFGFEPEVTAKVAKIRGIRIYEVGISYSGRTYEEGKKINWKDGFRAVYCIIKYGLFA